jgi:hypothetical protein
MDEPAGKMLCSLKGGGIAARNRGKGGRSHAPENAGANEDHADDVLLNVGKGPEALHHVLCPATTATL